MLQRMAGSSLPPYLSPNSDKSAPGASSGSLLSGAQHAGDKPAAQAPPQGTRLGGPGKHQEGAGIAGLHLVGTINILLMNSSKKKILKMKKNQTT